MATGFLYPDLKKTFEAYEKREKKSTATTADREKNYGGWNPNGNWRQHLFGIKRR